jgi:hypothetical protein
VYRHGISVVDLEMGHDSAFGIPLLINIMLLTSHRSAANFLLGPRFWP